MSGNWKKSRQTMKKTWQIDKHASDWECDPKGEELFHLRYFRSLPMEKKIQAIEEMCALAAALHPRKNTSFPSHSTPPVNPDKSCNPV